MAHEYGHHVQNLDGHDGSRRPLGHRRRSDTVRLELQADCYAGLWAGHAATTVDPDTGVTFIEPITDAQLADALSAAQAVGDDHIQEPAAGRSTRTWTHGSSEQRQRWFTAGYERRSSRFGPRTCDHQRPRPRRPARPRPRPTKNGHREHDR